MFQRPRWLKLQADKRAITYHALDNGIASSSDPRRIQALANGLSAPKVEVFARKWLCLLPHPYTRADQGGYHYDISILQAEFSLTQVFDRPVTGRVFFEEVIREYLDIGPPRVALIFDLLDSSSCLSGCRHSGHLSQFLFPSTPSLPGSGLLPPLPEA